jgi:hypothetical protein
MADAGRRGHAPEQDGRAERPVPDEAQLRTLGAMLVDLHEAERLLHGVHQRAIALGADDIIEYLDSEFFWKLRGAGDHLRAHFDLERVHGGQM